MIVCISLRETDAVDGFGGRDDDFLDAEFGGGFDYVVGGADVCLETLGVGDEHVACICFDFVNSDRKYQIKGLTGEMDNYIWRTRHGSRFVASHVEVAC